jgi:hypothetical protein
VPEARECIDRNDKRTNTVCPGGTTHIIPLDESSRPKAVRTTSGTTTLGERLDSDEVRAAQHAAAAAPPPCAGRPRLGAAYA